MSVEFRPREFAVFVRISPGVFLEILVFPILRILGSILQFLVRIQLGPRKRPVLVGIRQRVFLEVLIFPFFIGFWFFGNAFRDDGQ